MSQQTTTPDFRRLFERSPGLYLVLDPDLCIVAVSEAYLEATMTRREDIIGRGLFEVFPDNPDDPDATGVSNLAASLERVRTKKVPDTMAVQKYDIRKPAEDGGGFEERFWSPMNLPVVGPDGRLEYIIHRVEDVTEYVLLLRREAASAEEAAELQARTSRMESEIFARSQELRELNKQLEASNNAKSEFLSRVSHELRTPLAAILGFGELLGLSDLGDEEKQYVDAIVRAGNHLLELINEVLDISRIDSGRFSMSVGPLHLGSLLREVVELVEPIAHSHDVSIVHRPAASDTYVSADPQRLKQVCLNLLSNAIKFNRPQGSVTLDVTPRDGVVRIAVADTGQGLTAEALGQLFVPFERLDAGSRGIPGTGLGLTLSKGLAEAMGGRMGASSVVGQGSTFWVELPVAEPSVLEEEPAQPEGRAAVRAYAGSPTVLYIEDVVANVQLIEQIVKRRPGARLISAMMGETGIELAAEHRPNLILLDLHLPDIDGLTVLQRLRADEQTREIPVVILSADATKRQQDDLLKAGAVAYLTKPIRVRKLLEVLDRYLEPTA